jgi:ABC-type Mn2+/Zn2+ transport system ATPase subunit
MQDVGFGYRGGPALLSNMTLSLQPGMFHFLTGPSGAGKTTLLRMLYADLLPTSGRITAFAPISAASGATTSPICAGASAWCIRMHNFLITCRWPKTLPCR